MRYWVWLFICGVILSACGENAQEIRKVYNSQDESWRRQIVNFKVADAMVEYSKKIPIDLVWVIDDSGSMQPYQQAVKDNTAAFMQELSAMADLDWQMGMISTDVARAPLLGFGAANRLDFLSVNPVSLFQSVMGMLGLAGTGVEKTFDPLLGAIKKAPSFIRTDALLAVMIVTDAPEQSAMSSANFVAEMAKIKPDPSHLVVYGAFGAQDLGCAKTDDQWNYAGSKYQMLVDTTHGKHFPLCAAGFGKNLTDIVSNVVRKAVKVSVALPAKARPSTIEVAYRGKVLSGSSTSGPAAWYYDANANTIVFPDMSPFSDVQEFINIKFMKD